MKDNKKEINTTSDFLDILIDPIVYCEGGLHFITVSVCKARQEAKRRQDKTFAQRYCKSSCWRINDVE